MRLFACLSVGLVALVFACGGNKDQGVAKAKLPEGVRSQAIEHESCEEDGHRVETLDVNNDGKADIRRVFDGNVEVCRITDLNRDGHPDLFEYYDKTGQLRRREADFDDNGIVNVVEIYENGKLVRAEIDATNQGRIDTWDTFDPATGKRIKRERDSSGHGRVDQWWTWNGDQVTIAMDRNGDGKPDPDATVTLGGGGAPAPAASAPSATDAGVPPPPPPPVAPAPPDPTPSAADAGAPAPRKGGAKK